MLLQTTHKVSSTQSRHQFRRLSQSEFLVMYEGRDGDSFEGTPAEDEDINLMKKLLPRFKHARRLVFSHNHDAEDHALGHGSLLCECRHMHHMRLPCKCALSIIGKANVINCHPRHWKDSPRLFLKPGQEVFTKALVNEQMCTFTGIHLTPEQKQNLLGIPIADNGDIVIREMLEIRNAAKTKHPILRQGYTFVREASEARGLGEVEAARASICDDFESLLVEDISVGGGKVSCRDAFLNRFKQQMYEMSKDADEIGQEGYAILHELCDEYFPKIHDALQKLVLDKKKGTTCNGGPRIISLHSNRRDKKRKSTNGCLK